MDIRIGVDTGGTFTDFVICRDGRLETAKLPSTPADPSLAILDGIKPSQTGADALTVIHGTTVATNALLERKGARIALITTKGFEDVLLIGRQTRRLLYSLKGEVRRPIVDRALCFGVEERTTPEGRVERSPDSAALSAILDRLTMRRVEAVAVSLINAYANPANERIIAAALARRGFLASVSHRILPEYREFERTSTTAVNAYLMPILNRYLRTLEGEIGPAELRIMQSNEGYMSSVKAKDEPIRTALSGPAGGVVGSLHIAAAAGFGKIISFDMGGTSTDVSLIDGHIRRTNENAVGDFPVRLPMIDIHSVGAGGGSIAYADKGGSLRVGPQSAGADPGPACYGKGVLPTVTDANLVLGRIDPDFFLGGRMRLYPERSLDVVKVLGRRIRKPVIETAQGIVDIANANMEKAIRVISIERGIDPREFALFSFGGAGGMHAADMASHLRINSVLAPSHAGVLSAFGLLLADAVKDYSRSVLQPLSSLKPAALRSMFASLSKRARAEMRADGFPDRSIILEPSLDMRYLGQSYEINVPCSVERLGRLATSFEREHRTLYSYAHPDSPVEIVNIRVKARGLSEKIKLHKIPPESNPKPRRALLKRQEIHYGGRRHIGPVFDRPRLEPGSRLIGPALVVDSGSTTFLPPGFCLRVDGYHNLIIRPGGTR